MRIVILGGGLAGLAAAVALTSRGKPCTILESRPRLGGRAGSFHDVGSNTDIDNCQHVTMGCCTNFRHFCELTGIADSFRRERILNFVAPDGSILPFSASSLPAPLHLAGAFAGLNYLTWQDKISLARGLKALAKAKANPNQKQPFSEWLTQHGQTTNAINRFWHVVLVSALSETLDRIDVQHARKVFVDSFLAHRDGWYVEVPTVPLDTLYGGQLTDWLTSRGSTIRLQTSVEKIEMTEDRAVCVRLLSGETIEGDQFIAALPFWRIKSVLPDQLANHPDLNGIDKLEAAPISSIHLWFDRPITDLPHVTFVDRVCQWMFNRTALSSRSTASSEVSSSTEQPSYYYQIVISASRELSGQSRDWILDQVLSELSAIFPETSRAKLMHSRQVTEHRAVFSPVPGVDALRPRQQSPVSNIQLAGDWTQTGWPATMEGAVRSGFLAAENVLKACGSDERLLKPDLPVSWLPRLLFGLRPQH